jgi:hypothetical protein
MIKRRKQLISISKDGFFFVSSLENKLMGKLKKFELLGLKINSSL